MALIKPIHGEMAGSIAGNTYARNRFGQYVRQRRMPVNPRTETQLSNRAVFAALASHWNSQLSQAERDLWDQFAANVPRQNKLGDQIFVSGLNWFQHINTLQYQVGGTLIEAAPSVYALAILGQVAITYHTSTGVFDVAFDVADPWVSEDGAYLYIQQGRPVGAGRNYFSGPFRAVQSVPGNATTPPTSPQSGLAAHYGVASGLRDYFRCTALRADGRPSPPAIVEATVTT